MPGRGTLTSRCNSGAPAAASSEPTSGAANRTVLITPASSVGRSWDRPPAETIPASGTDCPGGRDRGGVGHRQLVQRLVDGGRGGPDLLGILTVQRYLQRAAAAQHNGGGFAHPLTRGGEQLVALAGVYPLSSRMSATRDFIVVTVIAVPSTLVTVLRERDRQSSGPDEGDQDRRGDHPERR